MINETVLNEKYSEICKYFRHFIGNIDNLVSAYVKNDKYTFDQYVDTIIKSCNDAFDVLKTAVCYNGINDITVTANDKTITISMKFGKKAFTPIVMYEIQESENGEVNPELHLAMLKYNYFAQCLMTRFIDTESIPYPDNDKLRFLCGLYAYYIMMNNNNISIEEFVRRLKERFSGSSIITMGMSLRKAISYKINTLAAYISYASGPVTQFLNEWQKDNFYNNPEEFDKDKSEVEDMDQTMVELFKI